MQKLLVSCAMLDSSQIRRAESHPSYDLFDTAGDERKLSTDALATLIDATVDSLIPVSPSNLPSRAIKYNQNVTLSFVLLNEDASLGSGYSEWDIEEALASESKMPHWGSLRLRAHS